MTQDRITQIKDFLLLRETRRYIGNKTVNYTALEKLATKGLMDKVVFVSSNPLLLKAIEHSIKGNVVTLLHEPISFVGFNRVVPPLNPDVIILDKQTRKVANLIETLLAKGYEVYEF